MQDQVLLGMGGAVALNQAAIHEVMRLYDIANKKECFEKVVALGRHMIARQNKEAKTKAVLP